MYCESPYNLNNFDSEILSRFSWNSTDSKENNVLPEPSPERPPAIKSDKSRATKDNSSGKKTTAALKSHSDAERRRRERINAHLETLRELVPSKEKVDKATLLAQVIKQVKQLRKVAKKASEGLLIPMDTDEVHVEILESNKTGPFLLRASLCCDQSPELLVDLRKAMNDIPARVLKCEVSTLEKRVKSVFLIGSATEWSCDGVTDWEVVANDVREALCGILDKVSASAEFAQPLSFPRKRQRGSYGDTKL